MFDKKTDWKEVCNDGNTARSSPTQRSWYSLWLAAAGFVNFLTAYFQ